MTFVGFLLLVAVLTGLTMIACAIYWVERRWIIPSRQLEGTTRSDARYFVLFRDENRIVAALGPACEEKSFPRVICVGGVEYFPVEGEDTFFFWDELRDSAGATVGFSFPLPDNPTFQQSKFVLESENVTLDGDAVEVLLHPCDQPETECVQGFGSEIYCRGDDVKDCLIYMFDWSQNAIAFPLRSYCSLQSQW